MDITRFFIAASLGDSAEVSDEHIPRLGRNIRYLDHMMLEAPPFIDQVGRQPRDFPQTFLVGYLTLIWLHCMAIRDTLLINRGEGKRMWNFPALGAQARALQEAFAGMFYFCGERVGTHEKHMRMLLLFRHATSKRLAFADEIDPAVLPAKARENLEQIREQLVDIGKLLDANPKVKELLNHPDSKIRERAKRVIKSRDDYFLEPIEDIWARTGFDAKQYGRTWKWLSQSVHGTPHEVVSAVLTQNAESENASSRINLAVLIAIWTFTKAVRLVAHEFPETNVLAVNVLDEPKPIVGASGDV